MKQLERVEQTTDQGRLAKAYSSEKGRFISRLRAAGKSLEEAEDLVHDVYAETMEHLPILSGIRNLPAWINTLFTRRLVDDWRHRRVQILCGETDIDQEVLCEIISAAGLDPLEEFVRESLADALNDAILELPATQRRIIEAQVFGGLTFKEISMISGESIDTLTARKRYALRNLARALRHWIDE